MRKAVLVKLKVKPQDEKRLQETFSDYKKAWQFVSDYVFKTNCKDKLKAHHATYKDIRKLLPNLNSALTQEARNDAVAKYKSVLSNKHKIEVAPKLKKVAIRFDQRTSEIKDNLICFCANGGKRIKAEIVSFPLLENYRKQYEAIAPILFYRNGSYWASLTFEIPEPTILEGSILGIDMGIRILAACSDGRLIRHKKLNYLRRKTRFLKRKLQSKGTKSARRHLRKNSRKEQRQSKDATHCTVNEVLKTPATTIAVEDLNLLPKKYRKKSNRRKYSVPISEFLRILEYKGKLIGKNVVKVLPYYTSQDDCRGLPPGFRRGGLYIGQDGKILHADINAACNIALRAKQKLNLNSPILMAYPPVFSLSCQNGQAVVNQPIVCKSFGFKEPKLLKAHESLTSPRL